MYTFGVGFSGGADSKEVNKRYPFCEEIESARVCGAGNLVSKSVSPPTTPLSS